jgi:hypothetical protein
LYAIAGSVETAIGYLDCAARLNPLDRMWVGSLGYSIAYFVAGRYDDVLNVTERALREWPIYQSFMTYRAASLALLGRVQEGKQVVQRLLSVAPRMTVSGMRATSLFRKPGVADALFEGLLRVGLPE